MLYHPTKGILILVLCILQMLLPGKKTKIFGKKLHTARPQSHHRAACLPMHDTWKLAIQRSQLTYGSAPPTQLTYGSAPSSLVRHGTDVRKKIKHSQSIWIDIVSARHGNRIPTLIIPTTTVTLRHSSQRWRRWSGACPPSGGYSSPTLVLTTAAMALRCSSSRWGNNADLEEGEDAAASFRADPILSSAPQMPYLQVCLVFDKMAKCSQAWQKEKKNSRQLRPRNKDGFMAWASMRWNKQL